MQFDRRSLVVSAATASLVAARMPRALALADAGDRVAARSLAPSGRLRVAINLGNTVLAQRAPDGGLTGVSVMLARALATRLGVPLDLIPFQAGGQVFAALDRGEWDLAFIAIEPKRAAQLDFSPPYVFLEGTYMVRAGGPYATVGDLDRADTRIAVGAGTAYDLYLSRTLRHATLVRVPTSGAAVDLFLSRQVPAVAGVRQYLDQRAASVTGVRVLTDSFNRIDQAVAVPKGRAAGAAYVRRFVAEVIGSGMVRRALDATGQRDAKVATL